MPTKDVFTYKEPDKYDPNRAFVEIDEKFSVSILRTDEGLIVDITDIAGTAVLATAAVDN